MDFRQIKTSDDDFGLMTYDPAFTNTASCRSRHHLHRRRQGHPRVPRLPDRAARRARRPTSRWPTCSCTASCRRRTSSTEWTHDITIHTFVHENVKKFIDGFRHDAHPMGMLLGSVGALSTFYPDANDDPRPGQPRRSRRSGSSPRCRRSRPSPTGTRMGLPYVYPDNDLLVPGQLPEHDVQDDRAEVRAEPAARARARRPVHPARRPRAELLDQRDARASAPRRSTRTRRSPPASAALYGPLHGGANEAGPADAASASARRTTSRTSSRG